MTSYGYDVQKQAEPAYDTDPSAVGQRIAQLNDYDRQLAKLAAERDEITRCREELAGQLRRDMKSVSEMIDGPVTGDQR